MNNRFTDKAQSAIGHARAASASLGHGYVGTEHLLVGLLQEEEGTASQVLLENGLDLGELLELIKKQIKPTGGLSLAEMAHYSPRAQAILYNSEREANRFQSQLIGTEHILIAILRDNGSVANRLLNTLHINIII